MNAEESVEMKAFRQLPIIKEAYLKYVISKEQKESAEKKANYYDILYQTFIKSRDDVLEDVYKSIENRFIEFYSFMHDEDEANFKTEFKHNKSSFEIDVDFYGRGMNPPHSLHSEGHQDSMGVCLFLALNEQLSIPFLNLIVLDDVIMSVDSQHRQKFCKLLNKYFKETQLVITTHDQVWANQISQNGVTIRKNSIKFID